MLFSKASDTLSNFICSSWLSTKVANFPCSVMVILSSDFDRRNIENANIWQYQIWVIKPVIFAGNSGKVVGNCSLGPFLQKLPVIAGDPFHYEARIKLLSGHWLKTRNFVCDCLSLSLQPGP